MAINLRKSTPITFENLLSLGFVIHSSYPLILRLGDLYITCWNDTWQICNQEGCVGNEGNYNCIEEIITRI